MLCECLMLSVIDAREGRGCGTQTPASMYYTRNYSQNSMTAADFEHTHTHHSHTAHTHMCFHDTQPLNHYPPNSMTGRPMRPISNSPIFKSGYSCSARPTTIRFVDLFFVLFCFCYYGFVRVMRARERGEYVSKREHMEAEEHNTKDLFPNSLCR
jgi:hypothetical protein